MKNDKRTRTRIVAAALRFLEREGQEAVSMRRVARAVGLTAMAIYHHFPDRDALLGALADAETDRIGVLFDTWRPRGSAVSHLRKMTESYVDYAFARPRMFAFLFLQDRPRIRRFPADFVPRRSTMLNRVADTIAE